MSFPPTGVIRGSLVVVVVVPPVWYLSAISYTTNNPASLLGTNQCWRKRVLIRRPRFWYSPGQAPLMRTVNRQFVHLKRVRRTATCLFPGNLTGEVGILMLLRSSCWPSFGQNKLYLKTRRSTPWFNETNSERGEPSPSSLKIGKCFQRICCPGGQILKFNP